MSIDDSKSEARWRVKRAVLDVVAYSYHDLESASQVAHFDYLEDMLDEALQEYAEAYAAMKPLQAAINYVKAQAEQNMCASGVSLDGYGITEDPRMEG